MKQQLTCFPPEPPTQASRQLRPTNTRARGQRATPQHFVLLYTTVNYTSDSSLSSASSISTLQVRELCPISPQRPQCLSARTLFAGVSPSLRLLPSLSAIKSDTSPTVKVSSTRTYRLFRPLRFVSSSIALRIRACSSCSNTILCAICCAPLLSCRTCSSRELAEEPRRLCILCRISVSGPPALFARCLRFPRGVVAPWWSWRA
jgi:hypothetical protein